MTLAHTSSVSRRPSLSLRRAFTLVEILVAVAIIAVLIAILIPALNAAKNAAKKTATLALLGNLQTGLNQYFSDFNIYPVSSNSPSVYAAITPNRGPAMLAEGLMGYLPGSADGAGPPTYATDPHYGFRTRSGGLGKIYGPYATDDPKSFLVNKTDSSTPPNTTDASFIDTYGHEILYYRATGNGVPPNTTTPTVIFASAGANAIFNSDDDTTCMNADKTSPSINATTASPAFFQLLAGRTSNSLAAGTGSAPVTGASSFLLISAGPDGTYFSGDDIIVSNR
jgi:prepilin-type N-terminal cleavage/methylation domain-containing protein